MSNTFSTLTKSHNSAEYQTPIDFFDKLNKIFDFKCDPCTTEENNLQVEYFFTKDEDGLTSPWPDNTFINPPFGRQVGIIKWINKMKYEAKTHPQYVYVMLLPARVETSWFQDHIYNKWFGPCNDIYFVKGRLKFVNPELNSKKNPHIMGSMLWIMNASDEQTEKVTDTIPGVWMG